MSGFNDQETNPIKGDPTQTSPPGSSAPFNEGASALPGGLPKRDNNRSDPGNSTLLNDQGGDLGYMKNHEGGGV